MKNLLILFALGFSALSSSASASDICSSEALIQVSSVTQNGVRGVNIRLCQLAPKTQKVLNCKDLGARSFYSREELGVLKERLAEYVDHSTYKNAALGAAGGALVGVIAVALSPVTLGASVALIPMAVGAGLIGTVSGVQAYTKADQLAETLAMGVIVDEVVTVRDDEFRQVCEFLREQLNAL